MTSLTYFFFLKIHMEIYMQIRKPKHSEQGHALQVIKEFPESIVMSRGELRSWVKREGCVKKGGF